MDIINNVIKAMDGDQEAVSELYYATYPKLRAVAISILKNEDDADDIVQDSYIKAFSSLHQLDNAKKFEPWLCRIVSNKCKDYLKKNKPILFSSQDNEENDEPIEWSIEDESKEYNPEEVLLSEDTRKQIMDLLDSLPDDQRICLVYHVVQEMKISEIAELLEVSESTVKSRINYAKSKMKVKINDLEKKGVKLRSFAGFALFPFIRHLFTSQSASIPPISAEIFTGSMAGAAETTAAMSETIASSSSAVIGETAKSVVSHTIKHIGLKIASGIVAGIVTIITIATMITNVVQKEATSTDNASQTSGESSNIILNLSDQEILNLNSYLSYFSEQRIQEYPTSDNVLFTFALVFNKLYDGPIFDCDSTVCANLYGCQCISKRDIDNTTNRFFGKTITIENSQHIIFDNGVYHTEAADGQSYYWLSIAKEVYALDKNTYKVTFNIYEDTNGEAGGKVNNLDYYAFNVNSANKTPSLQLAGNGYATIKNVGEAEEKFILAEYKENWNN